MSKNAWLALLLITLLIVVVAAAVNSVLIENTGTVEFPLTIEIDGEPYVNGSQLDWGNMTWGRTYNRPLTLTNIADMNISTWIHTNEPNGTLMTWAGNNTMLMPDQNVTGWLSLVVGTPTNGDYVWDVMVCAVAD